MSEYYWVWTFVYFNIVFALKWYCVWNFNDLEILFHILLSEMWLCMKFYRIWNSVGYFIVGLQFSQVIFFSWIWNFIHLGIYLIWKSIETRIFLNWYYNFILIFFWIWALFSLIFFEGLEFCWVWKFGRIA